MSETQEDMVQVRESRLLQAKHAGAILYHGNPVNVNDNLPVPHNIRTSAPHMEETKMSAVRRTFCLLVTFDLILSFILWVIYTQLIGDPGFTAFEKQVAQYDFKYSLFDSVMMSAVRLTFLLLAYALWRLSHWWMIALTTFFTCVYLICKIFLFDFGKTHSAKNPLSFLVLIIAFILAWVETWWLDFRVLPHEKKIRDRINRDGRGYTVTERSPLIPGDRSHDEPSRYYSPIDSPEDSEDENHSNKHSPVRNHSSRESTRASLHQDYNAVAAESWTHMWEMVAIPDEKWKQEAGTNVVRGIVHARHFPRQGKVFKLQGLVEMSAAELFEEVAHHLTDSPKWNPTVIECKTIQVIDESTEISYSIAAEAGGGLITSRDFVTLRRWGCKNGVYMSAGQAVTHPDMPPQKKYVRGENGIGGWVFKPVPGQPHQCYFEWYLSTHLKGWLPQKLIDQTLSSILLQYLDFLREHIMNMKSAKHRL